MDTSGSCWAQLQRIFHFVSAADGLLSYNSSRLFSDHFGLPLWAAAALDSLLALNIDASMDVVAYRLHMWHWDWAGRGYASEALTGQWFGVPYGNFYGWLLVVFFYSLFGRLLEKVSVKKLWKACLPLLSILIIAGSIMGFIVSPGKPY